MSVTMLRYEQSLVINDRYEILCRPMNVKSFKFYVCVFEFVAVVVAVVEFLHNNYKNNLTT